jgi:hypothetical protein
VFASKSSRNKPCENDAANEFLKYESWFGSKKLQDRLQGDANLPPNVVDLSVSEREIPLLRFNKQVKVSTKATDAENDVLTYNYTVSGGKIIGRGANVIWDLQGLEPGTYSITASVDDGCGVCGNTISKTVTIR